ncbi:hypothetical protein GR927_46570 [Mycolicibacterium sp. 3033]|nr:hypothetical protein [Mycolicibacterium aurantiacum]
MAASGTPGANGADSQQGSDPTHGAGEADSSTSNADTTTNGNTDDDDDQGGASDIEKLRREAARRRAQLREVETERDTLRERLTSQQQAIIDRACAAARLTDRHTAAAGIDLGNLVDAETGLLDVDRLMHTVDAARREFGVGRAPAPNRQQGSGSGHHGQSAAAAFAEAFAPRRA